jgi:SAM-dependent methyltransferase
VTETNPRRPGGAEWNAAVYHRVSQPHIGWGARVLARLELRGDETVLDAGCGTGRLTAEVLERLPHGRVIAFDRSQNMLDKAREHLAPRFGERVRYVLGDLQTIGPETIGERVDGVFSTATFHWIGDHPRLFAGLIALLNPGGWLEAQCGGGPNLAALLARAGELMAAPPYASFFAGWPGPWEFADDATTADRLRAAGFVGVVTGLEEAPTVLPDAETYRDFLRDVIFGAHLARLPGDTLRHAFIDALTRLGTTDEPPFSLDYWRLNMSAKKP